jgi:2-(3-amino-3-carboxypropyl)histidine synthase
MRFDLELEKAISHIKTEKAAVVLIQLPDGLKSKAGEIHDKLEKRTGATILIWAGSCYGACDVPQVKGVDMIIQWGHSKWA